MKRIAVATAGAILSLVAIAFGAMSATAHESARAAYERESRLLMRGDSSYDAARSDALYQSVLEHRAGAERFAWLLAIGVAIAISAFGIGAPDLVATGETAPRRAWIAIAIDAAIALCSIGAAIALQRNPAHAAAAAIASYALIGAWIGAQTALLARGASLGMRLLRVRAHRDGRAPGVLRALGAFVLSMLAAWLAPIAILIRMRPVPLAWMGLTAHRA